MYILIKARILLGWDVDCCNCCKGRDIVELIRLLFKLF